MKALRCMIAVAALAVYGPAQAAVGDPEVILYRVPGVTDSGGAGQTGIVTVFHCTNFSGVNETVRVVVRANGGTLLSNQQLTVAHLNTGTWATRDAASVGENVNMNTPLIAHGTAAISATSVNVVCTAMLLDASPFFSPVGIKLQQIRFNPIAGTQE